jgi:hypothetical protein
MCGGALGAGLSPPAVRFFSFAKLQPTLLTGVEGTAGLARRASHSMATPRQHRCAGGAFDFGREKASDPQGEAFLDRRADLGRLAA